MTWAKRFVAAIVVATVVGATAGTTPSAVAAPAPEIVRFIVKSLAAGLTYDAIKASVMRMKNHQISEDAWQAAWQAGLNEANRAASDPNPGNNCRFAVYKALNPKCEDFPKWD